MKSGCECPIRVQFKERYRNSRRSVWLPLNTSILGWMGAGGVPRQALKLRVARLGWFHGGFCHENGGSLRLGSWPASAAPTIIARLDGLLQKATGAKRLRVPRDVHRMLLSRNNLKWLFLESTPIVGRYSWWNFCTACFVTRVSCLEKLRYQDKYDFSIDQSCSVEFRRLSDKLS